MVAIVKRASCWFTLVAACSLLPVPSQAKKIPGAAWHRGVLVGMGSHIVDSGSVLLAGIPVETYSNLTHFTLRGSQYIFHADRFSRVQDKPLHLALHENVEFAVVGVRPTIKDKDGKAHKLTFVSKELLEPRDEP